MSFPRPPKFAAGPTRGVAEKRESILVQMDPRSFDRLRMVSEVEPLKHSGMTKGTFIIFFLFLSISNLYAGEESKSFQPAWWCRGGHCQTIVGGLFRPHPKLDFRRQRLELPDGDFLDLDWLDASNTENFPLVIIFPGLAGSSQSSSVQTLMDEADRRGWNALTVNARGMSGEMNRIKETSHAGRSRDLDWVIEEIIQKQKRTQIYLVGFSLGGNVLLKWLGEKGAAVPPEIKKAVAVSVPYDLVQSTTLLDQGFNRQVYTRELLKKLKPYALLKEKQFPGIFDRSKVEHAATFKVYDREVVARLNGFKDEMEYWNQSGAIHYLDGIRIPVLLIHAANDPFFPAEFLPQEKIKKSAYLKLLLTADGGHVGFVSGEFPWQQERWLEETVLDFLEK